MRLLIVGMTLAMGKRVTQDPKSISTAIKMTFYVGFFRHTTLVMNHRKMSERLRQWFPTRLRMCSKTFFEMRPSWNMTHSKSVSARKPSYNVTHSKTVFRQNRMRKCCFFSKKNVICFHCQLYYNHLDQYIFINCQLIISKMLRLFSHV